MKYARQFYFLYEENLISTDEDDLEGGTIEATATKMLFLAFFLLNGARFIGSQPNGVGGTPENVTVRFLDAKTVRVVWTTVWNNIDRYDVTLKPSDANFRVVSLVAGNSKSITLRDLQPDTEYQVTITAFVNGKKFKSRPKVFRTKSATPESSVVEEYVAPTQTTPAKKEPTLPTPEVVNPDPTAIGSKYTPQTSTTVRGVEIGLVSLALCVWIIAIVLFFHRWGKIRMLLPYQPDYKSQQSLKVPGTGTTMVTSCTGGNRQQGHQEGPGCVQSIYERVTACRCCYERIASDENDGSDINE